MIKNRMLKTSACSWDRNEIIKNIYWMLIASIGCTLFLLNPVHATTIVDKGLSMSETVYLDVVKISTPLMFAVAGISQLVFMWSGNAKIAEPAKEWRNRALMGWLVINGLGFFVTYIAQFVSGGTTLPTVN